MTAKFRASRRFHFEDTKRIMAPRNSPARYRSGPRICLKATLTVSSYHSFLCRFVQCLYIGSVRPNILPPGYLDVRFICSQWSFRSLHSHGCCLGTTVWSFLEVVVPEGNLGTSRELRVDWSSCYSW